MEEADWSGISQGNKCVKKKYGKEMEWFGDLGCCFRWDGTGKDSWEGVLYLS